MLGVFLILLGLAVWTAFHMFPALAPETRAGVIAKIGDKPWRGVAALGIVLGVVLMVQGWGPAAGAGVIYAAPAWGVHVNNLLMLIAFILLGASHGKSAISRYLRHPMLTAAAVWAVAHLLANGEVRSVVLFAGMGVWAMAAMVAINRRDGPRTSTPAPRPLRRELIGVGISVAVFVVFLLIHPWLFGVSPLPG